MIDGEFVSTQPLSLLQESYMHNADLDVHRTLSSTTQFGDPGDPSKEGLLTLRPRVALGEFQLGLEKIAEESSELGDNDGNVSDEHTDAGGSGVGSLNGKVAR